jgi:hypothetical protein
MTPPFVYTATAILSTMGWTAQYKYNDTRTLIKITPTGNQPNIELWNRHAQRFTSFTPSPALQEQLQDLAHKLNLNNWTLLDGGTLDQKHSAIKQTIAIWDILVLNGHHLTGTTYTHRYDFLAGKLTTGEPFTHTHPTHAPITIGHKISNNILMPINHNTNWLNLWEGPIKTINTPYTHSHIGKGGIKTQECHPVLEGLVMKNPAGKLERGMKKSLKKRI